MIEAVMFWNEPNNKSHWDFEIDPEWAAYARMVKLAADAGAAENPRLPRVLCLCSLLAVIVSKALLLARDTAITDPSITRQIRP